MEPAAMTRASELRAKARELYDRAAETGDRAQRLPKILRAMELESEADAAERDDAPPRCEARREAARGHEQQPQRADDKKK